MTKHYFLATILPELSPHSPPEISFEDMVALCYVNLRASDFEQLSIVRRLFDLYNLRALWLKEPLSPYGTLSAPVLEEAIATQTLLPDYCLDFLQHNTELKTRLNHFSQLLGRYFRHEIEQASTTVRRYLDFEHGVSIVKTVLRAKKLHRELTEELQFESPDDPIVADALAQKDRPDYDPPEEYLPLKEIDRRYEKDPLAYFRTLAQWRFSIFEEWGQEPFADPFSVSAIVIYLLQWIEVEKLVSTDPAIALESH